MNEIVVIGGGCLGAAVCWRLAQRPETSVRWILPTGFREEEYRLSGLILDPFLLSVAAEGRLSPHHAIELARGGWEFMQKVQQDSGFSLEKTRKGGLLVSGEDREIRAWSRRAQHLRSAGMDIHVVDPFAARDLEPQLGQNLAGAIYSPETCAYRAGNLMNALEALLAQHNVTVERGRAILGIESRGGIVTGVRTRTGVVSATGVFLLDTSEVDAILTAMQVPVRPQSQPIMRLTLAPSALLPRKTILSTQGVMSFTGQSATFDCPTAKWTGGASSPTVRSIHQTLERFISLFPGAEAAEWMAIHRVSHHGNGLQAPVLGSREGMHGFWYALNCGTWTPIFLQGIGEWAERKLLGMEQQPWARELAG